MFSAVPFNFASALSLVHLCFQSKLSFSQLPFRKNPLKNLSPSLIKAMRKKSLSVINKE